MYKVPNIYRCEAIETEVGLHKLFQVEFNG